MTIDMKTHLEEIKEVLQTYGWRQGMMGNCMNGFCIAGASSFVDELHHRASYESYNKFKDFFVRKVGQLPTAWNDDQYRSRDQVFTKLDELIAQATTEEES